MGQGQMTYRYGFCCSECARALKAGAVGGLRFITFHSRRPVGTQERSFLSKVMKTYDATLGNDLKSVLGARDRLHQAAAEYGHFRLHTPGIISQCARCLRPFNI